MQKDLRIIAIEFDSIWCDKEANLKRLDNYLSTLNVDCDLVVLPEMFSTGFVINSKETINNLAEKNTEYTIQAIADLANKYNIAITGTFIAKTLSKIYNRAFFIEPSGDSYFYDKYHLFSIGQESEYYSSGKCLPQIIRYRGWNIMPIICYDLRFPVWCRNTDNKYDILLVMANWPKQRQYSWQQLLIARAIENQCYVCGVNRSGIDSDNNDYASGSSIIVDFKGNMISETISSNIIYGGLDRQSFTTFKDKFPVWKDADDFNLVL